MFAQSPECVQSPECLFNLQYVRSTFSVFLQLSVSSSSIFSVFVPPSICSFHRQYLRSIFAIGFSDHPGKRFRYFIIIRKETIIHPFMNPHPTVFPAQCLKSIQNQFKINSKSILKSMSKNQCQKQIQKADRRFLFGFDLSIMIKLVLYPLFSIIGLRKRRMI